MKEIHTVGVKGGKTRAGHNARTFGANFLNNNLTHVRKFKQHWQTNKYIYGQIVVARKRSAPQKEPCLLTKLHKSVFCLFFFPNNTKKQKYLTNISKRNSLLLSTPASSGDGNNFKYAATSWRVLLLELTESHVKWNEFSEAVTEHFSAFPTINVPSFSAFRLHVPLCIIEIDILGRLPFVTTGQPDRSFWKWNKLLRRVFAKKNLPVMHTM